jgi:hypothetical protein
MQMLHLCENLKLVKIVLDHIFEGAIGVVVGVELLRHCQKPFDAL